MRAAVIQFPGSNCDRDMAVALNKFCSEKKKYIGCTYS